MNFSSSNSSACESGGIQGISAMSLSGEHCNGGEMGAWWKNQIRSQIVHAKAEGVEREQRRQYAITLSEIEQARRVQEDKINSLEEAEERKRRREYAKAVIREEQWTRIREQTEAAARDEAERHRRRRMALKALKSEEARQIELRLQAKARLKTGNFELAVQEEQLRQSLRRRNRALFVAGIRLHIQYFRAMEHERFSVAGDKISIKRSRVEQAVRDIYLRDCFDAQESPALNPSLSASQQAVLPIRTSSFVWNHDEKPDLRLELSREILGATPSFASQTSSAADFFRPLPIPITADLHDSDRMSA
jgi:hypothetical protein